MDLIEYILCTMLRQEAFFFFIEHNYLLLEWIMSESNKINIDNKILSLRIFNVVIYSELKYEISD